MSPPTAKVVFVIVFDATERFASTLICRHLPRRGEDLSQRPHHRRDMSCPWIAGWLAGRQCAMHWIIPHAVADESRWSVLKVADASGRQGVDWRRARSYLR
jgi:hypothetical protein